MDLIIYIRLYMYTFGIALISYIHLQAEMLFCILKNTLSCLYAFCQGRIRLWFCFSSQNFYKFSNYRHIPGTYICVPPYTYTLSFAQNLIIYKSRRVTCSLMRQWRSAWGWYVHMQVHVDSEAFPIIYINSNINILPI